MPHSFADIPHEIRRRVTGGERVALILLDALGLEFLRRHDDHPLVRRLMVTPLRAQFPSTTTAHVTTMHFGVPVHEHGLYEWNILEPSLNELVCPLRFNRAGLGVAQELVGTLWTARGTSSSTATRSTGSATSAALPHPRATPSFTCTRSTSTR